MQGAVAFPVSSISRPGNSFAPSRKFPHYFVWGAVCKADTDLKAWSAFERFKSLNYLDFYIQIAVLVKDTYSSKATAVLSTQVAFFKFFFPTWK